MKHLEGPDFPTGAMVLGRCGIRDAYRTGAVGSSFALVRTSRSCAAAARDLVCELPYGVKKGGDTGVIKKIADLVNDKVMTEVSDVNDHSDKSGMRIQIDLKREAVPQVALNKLFKHTALQSTFGYNAVALVDGVPRTLSLLELVTHYLDYQREVVTRRSKHELRRAVDRAHVLEGYLVGLDNLDEVIALIRGSEDTDEARHPSSRGSGSRSPRPRRSSTFASRTHRAHAESVEDEYADLKERIAELRTILGDQARIDGHRPRGAPRDQGDLRATGRPTHRDRRR